MPNGRSSSVNSSASHPRCETTTAARTNWPPWAEVSPRSGFRRGPTSRANSTGSPSTKFHSSSSPAAGARPSRPSGHPRRRARRWIACGHLIEPSVPEPRQRGIQRHARHADAQCRCLTPGTSLTIVFDGPSVTAVEREVLGAGRPRPASRAAPHRRRPARNVRRSTSAMNWSSASSRIALPNEATGVAAGPGRDGCRAVLTARVSENCGE